MKKVLLIAGLGLATTVGVTAAVLNNGTKEKKAPAKKECAYKKDCSSKKQCSRTKTVCL